MPSDGDAGSLASARTVRVEATVRGMVQGVGFRYFAWREAMDLELTGWVSNASDGTVRCVAEGDRTRLEAFIARLREGPPAAMVERVDLVWMPPTGTLGAFGVRSGGHRGD
jgi:acylphosphatase